MEPFNEHRLAVGFSPDTKGYVQELAEFVVRATSGDPGDSDNIETIMEIVSADKNEIPSFRFFTVSERDVVGIFYRPKHRHVLVLSGEEIGDPDFAGVIEAFGFNPATLKPLT